MVEVSGALSDVVVIDLTAEFWGSLGTALLGDFGADVIRIESGQEPLEPPPELERVPAGWDPHAELAQRNKRSLALDLDREAGREILHNLVAQADVLFTDWPMSRLATLGLDYASLASVKPDLVYTRGSGFGPKGPDRDLPALDALAEARTGVTTNRPQPDQPPVFANSGPMYTAVMLGLGTMIALHHRAESGEGQEVDASLMAGNMYGASLDLQAYLAMEADRICQPASRLDAGNPMSGVLYPARDGRWVCLTMPDTDRWWPAFSEIVGIAVDDPRFDSHEKRCGDHRLELIELLGERFAGKTSSHWKQVLGEKQLSADVIEQFDYPTRDPQVARNRYVLDVERPGLPPVKTLGFPIFMSDTPARLDRAAPARGQHSAAVLHDRLGYSEEHIARLVELGVVPA